MAVASPANFERFCDSLIEFGTYKQAAFALDPPCKEPIAWRWMAQSRKDKKADLRERSEFWFQYNGDSMYLHEAVAQCRAAHIEKIEGIIRTETAVGQLTFNGGEPVWMVDASVVGYPEQDRWLVDDWPYLHDDKGARVQAREPIAATTRNLVLAANIDSYNPTKHVDVEQRKTTMIVKQNLRRKPRLDTPGIQELEALARGLANPNRLTRPIVGGKLLTVNTGAPKENPADFARPSPKNYSDRLDHYGRGADPRNNGGMKVR
jgi:hypothetical protein